MKTNKKICIFDSKLRNIVMIRINQFKIDCIAIVLYIEICTKPNEHAIFDL